LYRKHFRRKMVYKRLLNLPFWIILWTRDIPKFQRRYINICGFFFVFYSERWELGIDVNWWWMQGTNCLLTAKKKNKIKKNHLDTNYSNLQRLTLFWFLYFAGVLYCKTMRMLKGS